jgi:uncharacterized protein (TIGR02611 family)
MVGDGPDFPYTPPMDSTDGDRTGERFALLREAALQAEYATGKAEQTEQAARRHIVVRVATVVVGSLILIAGLVMIVLPGPGIVGILAGLGILSRELPWAERMIEYVKKRAKVDELKKQPKWIQIVMWLFTIAAMVSSFVYFFVIR